MAASKVWLDESKVVPEVHTGGWPYDIRVCIGSTNVVVIDKLYGPLLARTLRVSLDTDNGVWVIERQTDVEVEDDDPPVTHWVEFARIPIDDEK
jgi:hypothetical protein